MSQLLNVHSDDDLKTCSEEEQNIQWNQILKSGLKACRKVLLESAECTSH